MCAFVYLKGGFYVLVADVEKEYPLLPTPALLVCCHGSHAAMHAPLRLMSTIKCVTMPCKVICPG